MIDQIHLSAYIVVCALADAVSVTVTCLVKGMITYCKHRHLVNILTVHVTIVLCECVNRSIGTTQEN